MYLKVPNCYVLSTFTASLTVQLSCFQELVDKLLTSKLADSPSAKAGLEDMRLLLSYCKLYTCSEVSRKLYTPRCYLEMSGGQL